jgi:hypothetical protein
LPTCSVATSNVMTLRLKDGPRGCRGPTSYHMRVYRCISARQASPQNSSSSHIGHGRARGRVARERRARHPRRLVRRRRRGPEHRHATMRFGLIVSSRRRRSDRLPFVAPDGYSRAAAQSYETGRQTCGGVQSASLRQFP